MIFVIVCVNCVSGLNSKRGVKRGKDCTGPITGVELCFYKKHKWFKLTQKEIDEVIDIRKREKGKMNRDDNEDRKKITKLEAMIKEQEQKISTMNITLINTPTLPPNPPTNPLQPPTGFTQRR